MAQACDFRAKDAIESGLASSPFGSASSARRDNETAVSRLPYLAQKISTFNWLWRPNLYVTYEFLLKFGDSTER